MKKTRKKSVYKDTRKYWYSTDVYVCVLCGRELRYRERVYDQSKSGFNYIDDACGCHF